LKAIFVIGEELKHKFEFGDFHIFSEEFSLEYWDVEFEVIV
jgi:hypothetical protein